jgi:hypothetical protein
MSTIAMAASRPVGAWLRLACASLALLAMTGCATHYVDGAVKNVAADEFTRPAAPKPVQVVVEFQTKGAANARATEMVKPMVIESVRSANLFADVQDKPVAGAGVLSVQINNVALTDDAYAKGFMTGLTFGLAGSTVTDGYLCTVSYIKPGSSTPVVKTSKHAIHTALGASGVPANGVKANSIDEAVRTMVRQIVALALKDLSKDASFP